MQLLENAIVDKEMIQDVIDNREHNETIVKYYKRLIHDIPLISEIVPGIKVDYDETLRSKIDNINKCNEFWYMEKYEVHKLKDVKNQNLCRDKFCSNCKKAKQAARMAKYIPTLEKYQDRLYHLILTIPNCKGIELKETIKKMNKCFKYLIQYIRGDRKTSGIDFSEWNYEGAVRSLEVTFKRDSYHPHFHVGLVLDPSVMSKKNIINTYSFNFKKDFPELIRLFSKEEILIQKIWYLLINGKRVNKKNIDGIKEIRNELNERIIEDIGYSCVMDKFPSDQYAELFKYMTKGSDEEGSVLTYDNFLNLYRGLYRVKQIQGYGCLYKITDEIDLNQYVEEYKEWVQNIAKSETPLGIMERPEELIVDTEYKVLNFKTWFKYIRQL